MLFQINREKKAVLNQDAVKICPILKDLSEQDLLFIILGWDYRSPYHQFPEEERFRKASKEVYGKVSETKMTALKESIDAYRSLQYDTRRETIQNYKKKIVQMNELLMNENGPREITAMGNAIESMMERCEKVQMEVDRDEQMIQLKGDGSLTFIEKWQQNRLQFLKDQEKKGIVLI